MNCFGSSSASAGSTVACGAELLGEGPLLRAGGGRDDPAGAPAAGELDGEAADPARAGDDDDRLALGQVRAGAQQVPRGRALEDDGQRLLVADAVGHRPGQDVVRDGLLGVAAAVEQADDPRAAADRRADELRAGDQRQLLRAR